MEFPGWLRESWMQKGLEFRDLGITGLGFRVLVVTSVLAACFRAFRAGRCRCWQRWTHSLKPCPGQCDVRSESPEAKSRIQVSTVQSSRSAIRGFLGSFWLLFWKGKTKEGGRERERARHLAALSAGNRTTWAKSAMPVSGTARDSISEVRVMWPLLKTGW